MNFLQWLGDITLGPRCPDCGQRCRGWRTLLEHAEHEHPETLVAR